MSFTILPTSESFIPPAVIQDGAGARSGRQRQGAESGMASPSADRDPRRRSRVTAAAVGSEKENIDRHPNRSGGRMRFVGADGRPRTCSELWFGPRSMDA